MDHAPIAVNSIRRVHKQGGGAGRVEGGRNFLGNDRALANTAQNDSTLAGQNRIHSGRQRFDRKVLERQNGLGFQVQNPLRNFF